MGMNMRKVVILQHQQLLKLLFLFTIIILLKNITRSDADVDKFTLLHLPFLK